MPRDSAAYLQDILGAIKNISDFTKGMDLEKFSASRLVLDAVTWNLEVIGEASKRISMDVKERYPEAEWSKIAGLWDILAHAYFGIDNEILWDIVENKLLPLKKVVERALRETNGRILQ